MEREAKFPVPDPVAWEGIAHASRVAGIDQVPLGRERQRNTYFDTEDGALARQRYACRLREVGERLILTVKGPAEGKQAVQRRYEAEQAISAEALEVKGAGTPPAAWVEELLPAAVRQKVAPLKPLVSILCSGTERRTYELRKEGCPICEMCLDEVCFEVGGRAEPVYRELELELKGGTEGELARLIRWFREEWGLETTARSKLEVGLELTGRRWPPEG